MEFHISTEAYLKIFSHCIKYPVNQVTGILVGKVTEGSPSKVNVINAIPVTHESVLLSHNIEIALRQVNTRYIKINIFKIYFIKIFKWKINEKLTFFLLNNLMFNFEFSL